MSINRMNLNMVQNRLSLDAKIPFRKIKNAIKTFYHKRSPHKSKKRSVKVVFRRVISSMITRTKNKSLTMTYFLQVSTPNINRR